MPLSDSDITDLWIDGRDLAPDIAGIPQQLQGRDVIAQDLKHAILDSGILVALIGERSPLKWAGNLQKLELLAEDDPRIIPGSVIVERDRVQRGRIYLFAETVLGQVKLNGALDQTAEGSPATVTLETL